MIQSRGGCLEEESTSTYATACLPDGNLKASDGTHWFDVSYSDSGLPGRQCAHNVVEKAPGALTYAKRFVVVGSVLSAFSIFIDVLIIRKIINCSDIEARNKLNDGS